MDDDLRQPMDPQMAQALERVAAITAGAPRPSDPRMMRRLVEEQRRPWNANPLPLPAIEESMLPGPFGDVPVRIYRPDQHRPAPAIVYLHGGGWVHGSLDTHDKVMRLLALKSGWTVLGIDYVLAPEHKFPDPVNETAAAFRHLHDRASEFGVDPRRLAVAGDSAGANLAVAAAMDLRDAGGPLPRALLCFYGVFDTDLDTASYRAFGRGEHGLTRDEMAFFWDAYLGSAADRANPRAALVKGRLDGLPPLHLMAAGLDPLRDDTLHFAARCAEAGLEHELSVEEGVCHGFLIFSDIVDKAHHALDCGAAFLRRFG